MKKLIYAPRLRYLLITYEDGYTAVIYTTKPYNDINDFPDRIYKVVKCENIAFKTFAAKIIKGLIREIRQKIIQLLHGKD